MPCLVYQHVFSKKCPDEKVAAVFLFICLCHCNYLQPLSFQVSVCGQTATGSGPNKKLAKRAAADNILQVGRVI